MKKIFLLLIIFYSCSNNSSDNNQPAVEVSKQTNISIQKDTSSNVSGNDTLASSTSLITCPKCGHKKTEVLPTEVCLLKYTCENCRTELMPKKGDCCVFCSYGTHKCPSMQ